MLIEFKLYQIKKELTAIFATRIDYKIKESKQPITKAKTF